MSPRQNHWVLIADAPNEVKPVVESVRPASARGLTSQRDRGILGRSAAIRQPAHDRSDQ